MSKAEQWFAGPHPDGGWQVKRAGAGRASSRQPRQSDAVKEARRLARNSGGGEVLVQRADGTIRKRDTVPHAPDPFPPPG